MKLRLAAILFCWTSAAQQYTITTVWGTDSVRDGRPAERALFEAPSAVAFYPDGRMLIADVVANRVRLVVPDDAQAEFPARYQRGEIRTVAGVGASAFSGDGGSATAAHLQSPSHLVISPSMEIYIGEALRVRKVDASGVITTVAGGGTQPDAEGVRATSIAIVAIGGMVMDSKGTLFISEPSASGRVRAVTPAGDIRTIAGSGDLGLDADGGSALRARLLVPNGLAVDKDDNLYVSESGRYVIRKITPDGRISTFAGTGSRAYAGDGGPADKAQFLNPYSITVDDGGRVIVLDTGNLTLRAISKDGTITTIAGPSAAYAGTRVVAAPNGEIVTAGSRGIGFLYDTGVYPFLSGAFAPTTGFAATASLLLRPNKVLRDGAGYLYTLSQSAIYALDHRGMTIQFSSNEFNIGTREYPWLYSTAAVAPGNGGDLWLIDANRLLRLSRTTGALEWLAGTGVSGNTGDGGLAANAQIQSMSPLAVDSDGNRYIASASYTVRRISPDGVIDRYAGTGERGFSGDGQPATQAQLGSINSLAVDRAGTLYIADGVNRRIRAVSRGGTITTFAGGGDFSGDGPALGVAIPAPPLAVAAGPTGDIFFATMSRVYRVNQSGWLESIAGSGLPGFAGDGGPANNALLNYPAALWVDGTGAIYIADTANNRIRKLTPVE